MPHQINISFDASVDGQTFVSNTRTFSASVYDSIDHTIAKDTTSEVTIADVLPADPKQVHVLILTADVYGESLEYKFKGRSLSALQHPLILFGPQVDALLSQPGENLVVKNGTGSDVRIRVLVGRESASTPSS